MPQFVSRIGTGKARENGEEGERCRDSRRRRCQPKKTFGFKEKYWNQAVLEAAFGGFEPFGVEALCDGCGRCCLVKLEDEDTGEIHFTNIVCRLFETQSCRCSDYAGRKPRFPTVSS